jgi:uncharacterized membrane protein SpoIIM required for sporulation
VTPRSYTFRRERERSWRSLERLITLLDTKGVSALSEDDLHRLPGLYRSTLSSLSVARAISLDRNVVEYLESLTARAYVHVYGSKRRLAPALARFFSHDFPALVWSVRRRVAVAAALLALGVACGYFLTLRHPDLFFSFVPDGLAQGRSPLTPREDLLEVLRGGDPEDRGSLAVFAGSLFSHNAQIGLGCFVLGVAAGVPVALLLFSNGVILGAFAAVHQRAELGLELWGWLLPHGVTELLAICLCGAAGLLLGTSWIFPGRLSRLDAFARQGRRAAALVGGCVALFLVAGLIEGFFRQLVVADAPRYALAATTAVAWWVYFGWWGRRTAAGPDADRAGAGAEAPEGAR